VETQLLVRFVKEHTFWKLLLDVADLYWFGRGQFGTVNLDDTWVRRIVAPNLNFILQDVEICSSLEMKTLILLNRNQSQGDKIWSTNDKSLEGHMNRSLGLKVLFDFTHGNHYLLVIMSYVKWSNHTMVGLPYSEGDPVWEHEINVFVEFISRFDNSGDLHFAVELLEGVVLLSLSDRV